MALNLTPRFKAEIPTENTTAQQNLAVACLAAEHAGWTVSVISSQLIVVYTSHSLTSWGEKIIITVEENKVIVTSESVISQLYDFGKNKRNVTIFSNSFMELLKTEDQTLLQRLETMVKNPPIRQPDNGILPGHSADDTLMSGRRKTFVVTPLLLLINTVVFILMCISGLDVFDPGADQLISWGANFKPSTLEGGWWRLFTCSFIHIGLFHLLLNMYALLSIGVLLEPILGSFKSTLAYLLSGLTAALMSLWWHDFTVSAGASGAIFGMYGVFLALLTTDLIEKSARRNLLSSIAVFVGYNLIAGINGNIDNAGHIGGLLGGLFFGYCYFPILKGTASVRTGNTIMISLSVIIIMLASIVYLGSDNDLATFTKNMEQFSVNENKALEIYAVTENQTGKELAKKIRQGIRIWHENLNIAKRSKNLKLPEYYARHNKLVESYCHLRINCYQAMLRRAEENTEKYDDLIEKYDSKIGEVLNELEILNQ